MVTLTLTDQEIEFLENLLQTEFSEKRHELHYTDTANYKQALKEQLELIEALQAKIEALQAKIESRGKEKTK